MKKLTAIKLVNWHAFENETIPLKNSTLISGENGAGKSTILDAIQFILTCSTTNFNKAANESSKRELEGYVRFKTGKENNEYERVGNVTAHVALEFYEESKNNYLVIGAVIDSASETSKKILWYRAEKKRIADINFIIDDEPVDISNFKIYGKDLKLQSTYIAKDARKDFANRLGKLNERFFELLPKSLAFKPISNVKDFVYTYILEEKQINIEELRENIRTFKEFEEVLNEVKVKITKLKEIQSEFETYENHSKTIKLHEYIVLLAEEESLKEEIEEKIKSINTLEVKIKSLNNDKNNIDDEISRKNDIGNKFQVDLYSNSEYKALEGLKSNLDSENNKLRDEKIKKEDFLKQFNQQKSYIKDLSNIIEEKDIILDYYKKMNDLCEDDLEEYKISSMDIEKIVSRVKESKVQIRAEKDLDLKQKENSRKDLENKISELEKRNLQYDRDVVVLKESIINETKKLGKEVVPKILCELLEITDPIWKNAVEGYLNSQRFYFLVDEEDFDTVLKIYERLSKSKGLHSVGIINAKGLEIYDETLENSLAEVVTSKSTDAKRYINMILGKVIRCTDVSELKKYRTSITSTCMIYKNNVARAINPKIYKTPYIGADAYKYQLEQAKETLKLVLEEINILKEDVNNASKAIGLIDKLKFDSLIEKCDVIKIVANLEISIKKLQEEIKELQKNNTYMDIQMKLEEVQKEIKNLKDNKKTLEDEIIGNKSLLNKDEDILSQKKSYLEIKILDKEEHRKEIGSLEQEGIERFNKERENKSSDIIKNNFNLSKMRTKTMCDKCGERLKELQVFYNNSYDFGAEIGVNKIDRFFEELALLEKSKIVEYEENVKNAKRNAEEEFKEHFLSKIQENISVARREIKSLNSGLKNVAFGNEHYEFKVGKSKENKEYYDMIMDNENIGEGFTLFSTSYENKHKELLNELFEKLTLNDENTESELMKLTDYRNYMSYDIEIKYNDESTALFSKVCREKSGGETQTPFYVAMAASFLQLYKGALLSSESIGLILFDEAFDKMDEQRIMAMMEFYKELKNLQLIIGAPPQKIEVITPYVNTVIIAMKDDKFSYVENLINNNEDIIDEKL
ncbi:ATPase [Clostridium gelidum]|uniref:ATPase n=1 Tax=Clostridium gelidum TaxID=704125 RepID=A0ABM7T4H3_9CLOT|nr:SbcC/MukB-like Walker B domain-containing protein [Clostridium gelidum]BCZ45821.1 ATPase [Clostridium gelidum]